MKQIKGGLYAVGIGALVFTVLYILGAIEFNHQYNIVWWTVVLHWPFKWFQVFTRPSSLLHLQFPAYLEILIAFLSPFIAFISAKKLGYSSIGQIFWFVIAFLFPFSLLVIATAPRGNIKHQPILERLIGAAIRTLLTMAFFFGILFAVIGIVSTFFSKGGGVEEVWIPGLRFLSSRNLSNLFDIEIAGELSDFFCLVLPGILTFIVFFIPIFREEFQNPWGILKDTFSHLNKG